MALINCTDPASKCYPASGEHVAFISVKFEELRVTPSKSTESEVREKRCMPGIAGGERKRNICRYVAFVQTQGAWLKWHLVTVLTLRFWLYVGFLIKPYAII